MNNKDKKAYLKRVGIICLAVLLSGAIAYLLFFSSDLPLLDIQAGDVKWDKKSSCIIRYNRQNLPARIKYRGGMSSKYDKHSFSVELDEKISLADLPKDDDYILNASYIDKTMMRHKICYELFREMNPQKNIAAQCAYVNVNVNGEYEGLYVLMEKITAKKAGLNKNDTMAMLFKDPPVFWGENRIAPQEPDNYFQQKYPKIKRCDKTYYIEDFMRFLFQSDDAGFADSISRWIDVENVMDWHLLLLFTNNEDGLMKNFYLYKTSSSTPFRIAIWDYDHSFGRDCDNELNLLRSTVDVNKCILLKRLSEIPELHYNAQLKHRWQYLRKEGIFSQQHFEQLIKQNHRLIRNDVRKNFKRWPVDATHYFDASGYKQELDIMRQYMQMRLPQLDAYFDSIAD
ncbi:MAG: CotH kinase family protein [Bacteroidales bacterium]|nr:CotH kinase family protein [Bacteroidales bacterium]